MSKKRQAQQKRKSVTQKRPTSTPKTTPALESLPMTTASDGLSQFSDMPDHSTTRPLRQTQILQMQQQYGNHYVQQRLAQRQEVAGILPSLPALAADLSMVALPTSTPHVFRQGLLTPAEETAAVRYNARRYDGRSIQIIQNTAGANVDGILGPLTVEAVAQFQQNNGLLVDGKVGPETLNAMVPNRVANRRPEHGIQLVADFHNFDVTSDTLTVHFDAGVAAPALHNTAFESGGLRVIRVGAAAMASADDLHDAIQDGLAVPTPAAVVVGPRPSHLTVAEERAATGYNRRHFRDRRSALAIQGLVGTDPNARFGSDTVERIADYQHTHGITVDGMVGEETLREMVPELDANNEQNAAIRLIMDFYNLSERGALLDIHFDASIAPNNASTTGEIPGPSLVRIGPNAFARGFAGLVHTIAHELEHVRQRDEGIQRQPIREFLGEAIEIISEGMPEEGLGGFMSDARRTLRFWNRMTAAEQREHWERFEEVRDAVSDRFDAATAANQATHQATMNSYDAVVEPPAPP